MNRIALSIVGGLMGFAAGLAVVRPVTAFFSGTTVTWNASNCIAGIYTITSFVRGDDGVVRQTVTTKDVSLPKATITQQFPNLPARAWQASAITTGGGRTYRSSTQQIQGQGSDGASFGRSRPPETPPTGVARPRTSPPSTPPPTDPRSVAPVAAAPSLPGSAALPPVRTEAAAARRVPRQAEDAKDNLTPEQVLRRILSQLGITADRDAGAVLWRQLIAEDVDGDGVTDVVSIEWNDGGVSVVRLNLSLSPSGPSGLR
ncbi:MAG TPA: hypothetical protein VN700_04800 [Vicinamibacterales bacterium]|nr:hypothetical protein [Vicinamibacterales bacterium]